MTQRGHRLDVRDCEAATASHQIARELLGWFVREDRKVLRLLAVLDISKSLGSHAALQQLTYCSGPAWHPFGKAPRINDSEFLRHQHDLEPLASTEFTHLTTLE
jgi:hypothetical protein